MKKTVLYIALISLILPNTIFAHGGHGTGFVAGLTHPIFGLDHFLAILTIGIYGFLMGGNKKWLASALFIGAMVIGGYIGINATAFSFTEIIITLSVLVTGLGIATNLKIPTIGYTGLALLFGFIHGHAHGVEMPEGSNILYYFLGFIGATILISGLGLGVGKVVTRQNNGSHYLKLLGAFIAGMGMMLVIG